MPWQILDLVPDYLRWQGDPDAYRARYPALFQHYERFWGMPGAAYGPYPEHQIRDQAALVRSRLPQIAARLAAAGLDDPVTVVLLVGQGTTNGHAFWDPDAQAFVVWLPVEAYATPLQVDVFVTHEVLHGLHYTRQPALYFRTEAEQHHVGRQLLTEGVATWGTRALLGLDDLTALWADYVPPDFARAWYDQCRRREPEMARRALAAWDTSPETNDWFAMWDETDVTRYRGGYYLGLRAIDAVQQRLGLDLPALLAMETPRLRQAVQAALRGLANPA
ncbi:MAG: hypothetical protein GXO36_06330 [Chloroflexi bacterium]|nr:hypothetical protein [Chloroflexota bacterium]